ncbi:MAG: AbrB/MazE/SpoVT family DNA-binding domain-containing protein [Candidatus Diapherotrites archaeon]|nr:AbrB/MazE/SpoVT family DNA-binding domain-containing protein [Candidatus Diapherotrites archaeon]
MQTITLSSKYQIVIPKKTREDLDLKPGQKLVALAKGNSIEFVKISDIKNARGIAKGVSPKNIRDHHERFD